MSFEAAAAPDPRGVLELRGVAVDYGARRALQHLDLVLGAAERVCLVGPNGAGKSTLVRCLTGLLAPATGTVALYGRSIASMSRTELARVVAVVPGSVRLPFAMTVEEVVALGRTPYLHPWSGRTLADQAAVTSALTRVGVLSLRDRDIRTLSMGERQLALIAMALAQGGSILVLDEPTVHLDLRHQVEVMELLVRLTDEEGMTVLAVLHDLSLAGHFFPRLAMLDHGRLVADGPTREILTPARIRDVYGVEPRFVAGLEAISSAI
jgi:iron complex transport system ATP-binding protein